MGGRRRLRRWPRDDAARMAARAVVDERAPLLGRLLGRRGARARARRARPCRSRVPPADAGAGCKRGLHVPSELALSEPYAGSLRVGCGRRRGRSTHRQSLLHALHGCVGRRAVRGRAPGRSRTAYPTVRLRRAREHDSRRHQGCRHGQPLDARHTNLLPNRGRRVPWLRRVRRHERLLFWQLHARLELRGCHRPHLSRAGPLAASRSIRLLDGRPGRHALPPAAARRRRPLPDGCRRRADGPDHEGVSGLAALWRRWLAARSLAEGEARHRICVDPERVGCRSRRRARGHAAQHI